MKEPNKYSILTENQYDYDTIESILNQSFGKSRLKRTVYKFRFGNPVNDLCLVLKSHDKETKTSKILASIRYWPILCSDLKGLLLGPLAVQKELQGFGYGKKLVSHSLEVAKKQRWNFCFVSGEFNYFKQFGFNKVPVKNLILPGYIEPERILIKYFENSINLKLGNPPWKMDAIE